MRFAIALIKMHRALQDHSISIYGENDHIFTARSMETSATPVRDVFDRAVIIIIIGHFNLESNKTVLYVLLFRCTEIISLLKVFS